MDIASVTPSLAKDPRPPASSSQRSFSITGDPMAGTRVSGYTEWSLHGGAALLSGFDSVSAAMQAASSLSAGDMPTVAVISDGDTFAVHAVELGFKQLQPLSWALPTSSPREFELARAMSTGGYAHRGMLLLGGDGRDAPSTPLVALVDGAAAAHVTVDPSLSGTWGFEPGMPSSSQHEIPH